VPEAEADGEAVVAACGAGMAATAATKPALTPVLKNIFQIGLDADAGDESPVLEGEGVYIHMHVVHCHGENLELIEDMGTFKLVWSHEVIESMEKASMLTDMGCDSFHSTAA
jgi:hypothetical protein